MDRGTDLNAAFNAQTAGQPQHLGSIRLHREIPKGSAVGIVRDLQSPAKRGVETSSQHRMIDNAVRPSPEDAVRFSVQP